MIVSVGKVWMPYTNIKDITDEPAQFVAPRTMPPHTQVRLVGGEIIRIEGVSASELAADINRQISAAMQAAEAALEPSRAAAG